MLSRGHFLSPYPQYGVFLNCTSPVAKSTFCPARPWFRELAVMNARSLALYGGAVTSSPFAGDTPGFLSAITAKFGFSRSLFIRKRCPPASTYALNGEQYE